MNLCVCSVLLEEEETDIANNYCQIFHNAKEYLWLQFYIDYTDAAY